MAKLLQTLIPILFSIALLLAAARSQTISFTYDFSGDQHPKDLTYQGTAHFSSDTTYLRLTDAKAAQAGRVLYSNPVQFWQTGGQVDFETTINFIITPIEDILPADGITFFVAPVGSTIPAGSTGGNLGIFNSSGTGPTVFAVEFDPYANDHWDSNFRHVGIDLGSRVSSNTTEVGGAITGQQVTARINYEEATKMITVHVIAGTKKFDVSYEFDLGSFLPEKVQVGLSASTGDNVATHDIVSWYFSATMVNMKKNMDAMIRQYV
ncbi:lectin alpha chain-like [Salvia miltiorrhiza]|uniref:lectin alpha chain-like n=1 Tax=Salvia miltiorrhiza TaxID=226208 RepID=UPI0025AD2706|nr:lectin alpha chain-like [Salvia miltiorrhiza]